MADSTVTVPGGDERKNATVAAPIAAPTTQTEQTAAPVAEPEIKPDAQAATAAQVAPPLPANDTGEADALADAAVKSVLGKKPEPAPNALQQSLAVSVGTNPDAEAEARRISLRTGVPIETVFSHPDEMKRKDTLDQIDFGAFQEMFPVTAGVLSDPNVAKIAHDDMDNMGEHENILTSLGTNYALASARAWNGAVAQFADYTGNEALSKKALSNITIANELSEQITPHFKSGVARLSYGAISGLVDSAPALLTGILNPIVGVGLFGVQAETAGYGKYRERGGTVGEASLGGALEGTISAAASFLPVKFLSDKLGKVGTGAFLTGFLARDLPSMEAQTIATSIVNQAIANPNTSWEDWAKHLPGEGAQAAVSALFTAGVLTAGHSGAAYVKNAPARAEAALAAENLSKAKEAESDGAHFDNLNAAAAASKVRERDPLAFQKFIEDVAQDGKSIENVYVDPRALAQSGIDVTKLAEASPSVAEQYRVSMETGNDMQIPVSEYTSHLAGTELGQAMVDHLKTSPLGMSRAEGREFMQGHAEQLKADVEKALVENDGDKIFQTSADAVHAKLLKTLGETRRFTDEVNTQYATLLSNFYKVQAARLGTTPEALFEQHPVEIRSVLDEGPTLDQKSTDPTIYYHGSVSGDLRGGTTGLHLGTKEAATQALEARIGVPAEGAWDGTREYGKTLLAGKETLRRLEKERGKYLISGHNVDAPEHDYYASPGKLKYADGTETPMTAKPSVKPYKLNTEMTNSNQNPHEDFKANGYMKAALKKGNAKRGYYYKNVGEDAGSISIVVPNGEHIKAIEELNQPGGARRGSYNPDTNVITLLKNADLSTFLHESGHFFLETMNKVALSKDAPDAIKADMQATFDWLGVKDIKEWNSHDLEWQREKHEQFARGFEAYLFEGKSPSIEMRGVFQRFRAWLLNVYRNLSALNVELTPEVRSVFDRMLATADQIKETEIARGFEPLFKDAATAGMDAKEWQAYQEMGLQATQDATAVLEARSMRDMKYATNAKSRVLKDLQREAAGRRREVRDAVTKEVMAEPVNQAREFVTKGKMEIPEGANQTLRRLMTDTAGQPTKLSLPALKEMYGEEANAPWRYFSTGKHGEVGTEGLHPDVVAEMFGFTSGDELVRTMLGAEKAGDKIEGLTDQRMLEKYGDLTDPVAMSQAADEAIHNEVRSRFVATELNALQKATGGRKILAEAAKRFASDMVARLRVRDINPGRYSAAEARAARASEKALKKGDLPAAAVEKRNQLIQNYAARAAHDAIAETDKAVRFFKKFDRAGSRENIDNEYLDQIDALLERFDLRKSQSLRAIDKRKSLENWVKSQEELGIEPDIPPELLDAATRKSYKDMTLEEVRGLRDTIKQIEHLGKLKNKLLTAKDARDFKTTVDQIVASIDEHGAHRVANNRTRPTAADMGKRLFKGFVAQHRKVASLVREIDGFKDGGPLWETFVRTMNDAGNQEATMRAEATKKLAALVEPILDGGKMGGKGQFFESVGKSFNREERIGIALNTGNEGNFQRLLDGEGWTHEQVAPILDTLTKADWDFVQNIWDFFESYRPQIGAKEKRIYGKQPEWVDPVPVHTKFGDYKGGYYPIKYDTRQSIHAEQHADAEGAKAQMRGAYTSATTRRSFTKTRAEEVKGRPLLYSMDGLYRGVNEIIHDLSWHEWLIDANRLLRNKSLDGAIRSRYGADVTKQFKTAVQDIAAGEMPNQGALDNVLNHMRAGTSVAGLGLNIMNSVINMTGALQSVERIGPKWMAMGVAEWAANPRSLTKRVAEKSELMANRARTMQREINEIQSVVRGKSTARQIMDKLMYLPMQMTQIAVDTPTWWGAYQKALTEGHADDKAVALADQAVLDAQGGGMIKDLAGIQRGPAAQKLFTTFYGYFNTTHNLSAEAVRRTNFKDPKSVLKLGASYLMLYALPAALGTLIHTAVTNDDDKIKPKKLAKKLANDQLSYLLSTMVGVRELTGAVQTAAGVNDYNMGYSGPAGLRAIQETYNLATQIHQGEADDALFKAITNVLGIVFHLPAAQVNRTVLGTKALIEGDTDNPAAVVAGPPPKK